MFGKRRRLGFGQPVEPDLPITPMLDMSFQLLFYFVVTFKVMPTEGQIPLTLPREEGGPSASASSPARTESWRRAPPCTGFRKRAAKGALAVR